MSSFRIRLFNDSNRYISDQFEYGFKDNNSKYFCDLVEKAIFQYVYRILDLLSEKNIIVVKTKPVVYFQKIRDENLFGDKEILGFMVNYIKGNNPKGKRWEEDLFLFFRMNNGQLDLESIDYALSSGCNLCKAGRQAQIDGDDIINCYNKERSDELLLSMIVEKIISGRRKNINKLTTLGY